MHYGHLLSIPEGSSFTLYDSLPSSTQSIIFPGLSPIIRKLFHPKCPQLATCLSTWLFFFFFPPMYLISCDDMKLPRLLPPASSSGEHCCSAGTGFGPEMLCYTAFAKLRVLPSSCLQAAKRNILIILEKGLVWDQLQIVGCRFWIQGKTGEDYAAEWAAAIREIQDEKCLLSGKPGNVWGCRQTVGTRISLSRMKQVTVTIWKLSAAPNC